MAARFTHGDSEKTTRNLTAKSPPPNVHTKSHVLNGGNTMSGQPGFINAHQTENMGHAKGGQGFGPHREGSVGQHGKSRAKSMGKGATGTTTSSYHSDSTGSAGTLKHGSKVGSHHIHTSNRSKVMPGQKPPPTSKGKLGGTIRAAGIDRGHNERSAGYQAAIGHAGRMEKLSGRAKTHAEGRRKSVMY